MPEHGDLPRHDILPQFTDLPGYADVSELSVVLRVLYLCRYRVVPGLCDLRRNVDLRTVPKLPELPELRWNGDLPGSAHVPELLYL